MGERSHTARTAPPLPGCPGSPACYESSGAEMSTVEKGALPRQDNTGWRTMTGRPLCSPGVLEGDTLIKGTQRSESTVSLCWKLSPPLKPHRLVLVLEGGWQGWEKMTGRLPEKKQTGPCMHKHQTNKSIFKSRPDKECLRMAIQVKPERAMRRSQGKADLGQHSTCVWIQFIFIY